MSNIFVTPWTLRPPGFSIHWISQTRILVSIAISFYRGCYWPTGWTCIFHIFRQVFYPWATRKAGYCVSWCERKKKKHTPHCTSWSELLELCQWTVIFWKEYIYIYIFFFSQAVGFKSELKVFSEWSVLYCSMCRV